MASAETLLDPALIAPCGMHCGLCLAHLRDKKICPGCNGDDANKPGHCAKCVIKNCELLKPSKSGLCYECVKFPCTRLKQLDKRYRTKYDMSMLDNLERIKTDGMERFLADEAARRTCKDCGGVICVHRGFCLDCKSRSQE